MTRPSDATPEQGGEGLRRTEAGQLIYDRLTKPDAERRADDPVRQASYDPCCLEHEPGKVCILPVGHGDLTAPEPQAEPVATEHVEWGVRQTTTGTIVPVWSEEEARYRAKAAWVAVRRTRITYADTVTEWEEVDD